MIDKLAELRDIIANHAEAENTFAKTELDIKLKNLVTMEFASFLVGALDKKSNEILSLKESGRKIVEQEMQRTRLVIEQREKIQSYESNLKM